MQKNVIVPGVTGKGGLSWHVPQVPQGREKSLVPISIDFISLVESVYLSTGVPVMNAQ